jgi:hypothetical protein
VSAPLSIATRLTRPCVFIYRAEGPADGYGDPGWLENPVDGVCYAEQAKATEPGDPHYQAEDWRIVVAPEVTVDGLDAVEIDGLRFEIVGPPWRAVDPRSDTVHHVELAARRTSP